MNNYKYEYNEKQLMLLGNVIYENGEPASFVNVVLECICPIGYYNRNNTKCRRCKYSKLRALYLSSTNEKGEFSFVLQNRNFIYRVVVVNNLVE